jgi:hypothetical protein
MSKIQARIKEYYALARSFGIGICCVDLINRYLFNENRTPLGQKWHVKKHDMAKAYMMKHYGAVISDFENLPQTCELIKEDAPIWVFWYQGLAQAPEPVTLCIESMKRHAGKHPVILVTKENYANYADIPDDILQKVEQGKITLTHFSDILRMALLAAHGGIWSDATVYWTKDVDDYVKGYPFFTVRHGLFADYHVCKGLWSGFFLAAGKQDPAVRFCRDMFFAYWKQEECLYCYYLIDVVMALGYEKLAVIRQLVDAVPQNNRRVFELAGLMNRPYDAETFTLLLEENGLHKLSYKTPVYSENNGTLTFYGKLMQDAQKAE